MLAQIYRTQTNQILKAYSGEVRSVGGHLPPIVSEEIQHRLVECSAAGTLLINLSDHLQGPATNRVSFTGTQSQKTGKYCTTNQSHKDKPFTVDV